MAALASALARVALDDGGAGAGAGEAALFPDLPRPLTFLCFFPTFFGRQTREASDSESSWMTITSDGASTSITSPLAEASRARRIAAVRSDERGGAATGRASTAARAARQGVDRGGGGGGGEAGAGERAVREGIDRVGGEAGAGDDRLLRRRDRSGDGDRLRRRSEKSAPARSAASTTAFQSSLRRKVWACPTTQHAKRALESSTFSLWRSARKPIDSTSCPFVGARTQDTITMSFSRPWNASTVETSTLPPMPLRALRSSVSCARYGATTPTSSDGAVRMISAASRAQISASAAFAQDRPSGLVEEPLRISWKAKGAAYGGPSATSAGGSACDVAVTRSAVVSSPE